MKHSIVENIINFAISNVDNILSTATGMILAVVSNWNGFGEIGLISFKALIVGIFGGIGGLLIKDVYKYVKKKLLK